MGSFENEKQDAFSLFLRLLWCSLGVELFVLHPVLCNTQPVPYPHHVPAAKGLKMAFRTDVQALRAALQKPPLSLFKLGPQVPSHLPGAAASLQK